MEKNEDSDKGRESGRSRSNIVERPKILFGILLIYLGIGLPFIVRGNGIVNFIAENSTYLASFFIFILGFSLFYFEFIKFIRKKKDYSFTDVDEGRKMVHEINVLNILKEYHRMENDGISNEIQLGDKTTGKTREIGEKAKGNASANIYESFESYFNDIRGVLLEQVHVADAKASILLDKGIKYSSFGISFFIVSIIIWQITIGFTEFKSHHIYGIASCSLLFIFIEFISAWFLKQYRQFVETSTYLLKVKSIFDKYMMAYLAIKDYGNDDDVMNHQVMVDMLKAEIKWPEETGSNSMDVNFARDALNSMSELIKTARKQ